MSDMTNAVAIETLRANYPDACYEQLREAVDAAIEALKAQDAAGDTISRKAAIDVCNYAIDLWHGQLGEGIVIAVKKKIKELPPAQPEIIRCKECNKASKCYGDVIMRSRGGGKIYYPLEFCSEAERGTDDTD